MALTTAGSLIRPHLPSSQIIIRTDISLFTSMVAHHHKSTGLNYDRQREEPNRHNWLGFLCTNTDTASASCDSSTIRFNCWLSCMRYVIPDWSSLIGIWRSRIRCIPGVAEGLYPPLKPEPLRWVTHQSVKKIRTIWHVSCSHRRSPPRTSENSEALSLPTRWTPRPMSTSRSSDHLHNGSHFLKATCYKVGFDCPIVYI